MANVPAGPASARKSVTRTEPFCPVIPSAPTISPQARKNTKYDRKCYTQNGRREGSGKPEVRAQRGTPPRELLRCNWLQSRHCPVILEPHKDVLSVITLQTFGE